MGVSSSLLPSLFSPSLFFSESVQLINTHTKTNTHKNTQTAHIRANVTSFSPARGVFISKSRIHMFWFPFFFLYRERREIELIRIRILVTKIVFSGRTNLYRRRRHRHRHRCARSRPLVRQAMVCAGDERNALKCAL